MDMRAEKRALDKIYKRRDRYEIPDWMGNGDITDYKSVMSPFPAGVSHVASEGEPMTANQGASASQEAMICIPGPWKDRTDFLQCVVTHTKGDFMFAGGILANPKGKDHVPLEFCEPYEDMRQAFEIAGQGKLPHELLDQIAAHRSVVYIRFPLDPKQANSLE